MIAPSPSRPASFNMPSRNAATRIGGCSGTVIPSRKPLTANVSYSSVTFSPESAARRNRIVSRTRWYGFSNERPFQRSTITSDEVPMPSANRPGAAWHALATVDASVWAPRVYTGTIAVPKRSECAHCDAATIGVNAS